MNDALIAAQQLREESREAVEKARDAAMRDAEHAARQLMAEAEKMEAAVRERTASAERQFAGYVAGLRALLSRQLAEIDVLETQAKS